MKLLLKRSGLVAAILLLSLGLLVACGGGSSSTGTGGSTGEQNGQSTDGQEQQSSGPIFLNMGSTNTSSGHYAHAVALAQSIEQGTNGRIRVNVVETGATLDNARRMKRGDLDFGLASQEGVYQIYHGTGAWEEEGAWPDFRVLFVYVPAPNIVVVRADRGINSLADLDGQPFSPGIQGSATESTARRMFEALGIEPQWLPGAIDEAVNYMKDGQIVGFTKAAAGPTVPDATYMDVSTFLDVKVLGLTDEELAILSEAMPDMIPVEIPAGVYPDQNEPMKFTGVIVGYGAPKDFDD